MKQNWLRALALAMVLILSLAALPAQAAGAPAGAGGKAAFADIENHWAREYIEDMAARGYANGDGDRFYPDRTMSALEALLFCARVTNVDKAVQEHIAVDRKEEVDGLIPQGARSWASAEVALALETGVVSAVELEELNRIAPGSLDYSGGPQPGLLWNVSREDVFMYLVRAMQLEPLARSFNTEVCAAFLQGYYADAGQISPALQPYVYVLTYYKILAGSPNGEGKNLIRPKDSITRGEMMKIVSLALNVMNTLDIRAELSEYTDYAWASGVVVSLDSQTDGEVCLTLRSQISGTRTYVLPDKVNIYRNNMRLTDNVQSLAVGDYVRLNFDTEGKTVESVRASGALTVYEGQVAGLDAGKGEITFVKDGTSQAFRITRFTEVLAGGEAGDRTAIDPEARYTGAVCYVDDMGALVGLKLTGGTVQSAGLLQSVTVGADGAAALTLSAFDGMTTVYTVPTGATVFVDGVKGRLDPVYVGCYVTLRMDGGTQLAETVSVDTLVAYLQGRVVRKDVAGGQTILTIANALNDGRERSEIVDHGAFITYAGEEQTLFQIETGWWVTARLVGGTIVELAGYPADTKVEGVLSSISYGTTTVLTVTLPSGAAVYELDRSAPPAITRSGEKSDMGQLRTGDTLVLTLCYNEVQEIIATPGKADLAGVVQGLSSTAAGNQIVVRLAGGATETYDVGPGISVTRNGAAATFRDLEVGDVVALVTGGGELLAIQITSPDTVEGLLVGHVYETPGVDDAATLTLLMEGGAGVVTVDLETRNAVIQDRTGAMLSAGQLDPGDKILVIGAYDGPVFVATLVTRL